MSQKTALSAGQLDLSLPPQGKGGGPRPRIESSCRAEIQRPKDGMQLKLEVFTARMLEYQKAVAAPARKASARPSFARSWAVFIATKWHSQPPSTDSSKEEPLVTTACLLARFLLISMARTSTSLVFGWPSEPDKIDRLTLQTLELCHLAHTVMNLASKLTAA